MQKDCIKSCFSHASTCSLGALDEKINHIKIQKFEILNQRIAKGKKRSFFNIPYD
jgi:hypothetical protein